MGGNPLVGSVSDPAGTISTRVDLLGRVVSSTDVWGVLTTTAYDAAGRAATSTVVAGATSFTRGTEYDAFGRPVTHKLNGAVLATAAFDTAGRLSAVSFPSGSGNAGNGSSGTFSYSSATGLLDANHWTQSDAVLLSSDEVTGRWETGRIRNQAVDGVDPNGAADNYVYDGAWRLTAATVASSAGSTTYGYGFAATGGCGDLVTAGANSNRTSKTVTPSGGSPVVSTYCYDNADRLTSTTDATVGALGYDDHGNTTTLGDETHVYDHANRHLSTTAPASGGGTTTVEYLRDATDRIVQRKVNGTIEGRYAHSAAGDTPTLALDGSNNVVGASLALPGGVLYKWLPATPGASLWEYPNLQGSLVATAGQTGLKIGGTRSYDPDGNQVIGATPDTGPGDFDYGWLGSHQRPLEHHDDLQPVIQMGARQYHPRLGRFLAVDPIEAGVHNDYGYVTDPINGSDRSGEAADGACMGVSAGFIIVVEGSICYWKDERGRELYTWGAGIGVGWSGASAGISVMWSSVMNVQQLRGWAACGSVGFSVIAGAAFNTCAWENRGRRYFTFGASLTVGMRGPSITATASATGVAPGWVRSLFRGEYEKLKVTVDRSPLK